MGRTAACSKLSSPLCLLLWLERCAATAPAAAAAKPRLDGEVVVVVMRGRRDEEEEEDGTRSRRRSITGKGWDDDDVGACGER